MKGTKEILTQRRTGIWTLPWYNWRTLPNSSIIDRHLTWHDHIEQLQSKIATRLGVLKRIKHLLPVYARRIYVSTMVIPILEYASIVWGDKNNKVLMDSIQVLQNKAAKLVLDRVAHSSSTQALLDLNWMNLSARRLMQRCFFMHNFTNDSEYSRLRLS